MPEVWLIKYKGRIVAADDDSYAALRRMPNGQAFKAALKEARNLKQHRLWHALANAVAGSSAISQNPEQIKRLWLAKAGFCLEYIGEDGKLWMVPYSTAIDAMPQDQFNDLFRQTVQWVTEVFLPGCDEPDILERVSEMVGRREFA